MPSLRSIFTLQDNYSRAINQIYKSTDQATASISRASSATDTLNTKFASSESAASRLSSKLTGLAATVFSLATLKKGMDISDTYTNTLSKLNLITGSLDKTKTLQQEIFSAADRARGSYADMADTVAKLGIIAGKQFGSNDNIVKFTETLQKMFKIGGTPTANQSGALLQIQQAIGMGKLQGQDLRILAEDAPLVETAIAKYMGKSTGEIKKLGADGQITSDVLINSVLKYSGTVDQQIGKMSYTWGDYWNKIKNGATQAFGGVFAKGSTLMGSNEFKSMIDGIVGGFYELAGVAEKVLTGITTVYNFFASNWSVISPIVGTVTAALIIFNATSAITSAVLGIQATMHDTAAAAQMLQSGSTFALTASQYGLNAAMYACPITWIIGGIILVIGVIYLAVAAVDKWGNQTLSATGIIAGVLWSLAGTVYNIFAIAWNVVAAFVNFINHAFQNPIASIEALFWDLAATVNSVFLNIAQNIQGVLNKIPGVKVDMTSGLQGYQKDFEQRSAAIKKAAGLTDIMSTMQLSPLSDWAHKGYQFGQGIDSSVKNWTDKLGNLGKIPNIPLPSTTPIPKGPTTVKGTGADGSVKVNIADQDLQYLRDLAEKQYINKFSTAVLSPKLSVSFSGNVGDKNDQQKIYSTIGKMLREELATTAEGYYPV